MAVQKTEAAEQATAVKQVDRTAARGELAAREVDPRKRLVKMRLQRPLNSKSRGQTISVNNYRYFIPYGQTVEVPFFIAEVARLSSEQDERTAELIESLASKD